MEEDSKIRKKKSPPPGENGEELIEVVPCSAEQGIDPIAGGVAIEVAIHAMIGFQMADDGFDGGPTFPPATFPR